MIRLLCSLMLLAMALPVRADDARTVATWADRSFGDAVKKGRASAATVTVVRDGKVIFSRDYGFGDKAAKTPVGAPRDRFLIASVTKTFTATAIALLVKDGKIASLDDPVNKYLTRTKLPGGFGRQVTIRQLLTHSAGYEERGFGVGAHEKTAVPASGAFVQSKLPAIVRKPGSMIVYANIDPALLGVLVEDVSGMTMRSFMARRIFQPLGMADTELAYDRSSADQLVRPYMGQEALPWEINIPFYAPTGSVHTTTADMAKFMNAQLGYAPAVLAPDLLEMLHSPKARNHPALDAFGMAFFLSAWNGQPVIGHAGAFSGFGSDMYVVPSEKLGVYYGWAGAPAPGGKPLDYGELQSGILSALLGKFQPPAALARQPDPSAYVGRYWQERRPHTTFETIVAAGAVSTVTRGADNSLMIDGQGPYYAFAPGVYTRVTEDGRPANAIAFKGDMMLQRSGAAKRVSGLGDPGNETTLAMAALGLIATGLFAVIWMRGKARVVAPVMGVMALLVPALLFVIPPGLEADIIAGHAWRFIALKIIVVALSALALWLCWMVLRGRQGWAVKGHSLLILAGAVALLVPFRFFHLI